MASALLRFREILTTATAVGAVVTGVVLGAPACTSEVTTAPEPSDGEVSDALDDSAVGVLSSACDKPGTLACAGHAQKLQLLCQEGKWVANGVCPVDQICDTRPGPTAGSCQTPDPACVGKTPLAPVCEGSLRKVCGRDLLDHVTATCASPEHCRQGSGERCAECLDGSHLCKGAVLQKCASDRLSYTDETTCASAPLCDAAAGACKPPLCALGDHRCTGDILETCTASLAAWDPIKVCGAGLCDAAAKACRDCVPGTKDCAAGEIPRECDASGHWKASSACTGSTPLCKGGACVAGACAAGEYRCSGDNLEVCKTSLTGFDPVKVCGAGLCDAVGKECDECKSGTADCVGSTPRACDSTGHWKSLTACSGTTPVCKAGVCVAGLCSAGEVRCTGDTLETCNAALTGFDPTKVCGAGLCDAAGKECDDCKSGALGCLGNTPRTCGSTGHWTSLTPCSGSTPACSAGVCVASGFPGSTLISSTDSTLINGWIGVSAVWTRCYAKSVDGASPSTFHAKCDGKGPSVVVAKLSTGKIIGGYASLSWASPTPGTWIGDDKTFLFSLTNSFKHDYITTTLPTTYTQWTGADRGPAFGGGHDWMIDNTMNGGYCYMGFTFHCRLGADGGTDTTCRNDLCGTYMGWTIEELEVWVK